LCAASLSSGATPAVRILGSDLVAGALHVVSVTRYFPAATRHFLIERSFAVTINEPYAGGFTTGHYGRPRFQCHALQIEISRALYMNEGNYQRKPHFARLVQDLAGLVSRLGRVAQEAFASPLQDRDRNEAAD